LTGGAASFDRLPGLRIADSGPDAHLTKDFQMEAMLFAENGFPVCTVAIFARLEQKAADCGRVPLELASKLACEARAVLLSNSF